MRSEWVPARELRYLLAAMRPENRLACEISLATGLRISDVLSLTRSKLEGGNRFTVKEGKTGKVRSVYLPVELHSRALSYAGEHYIFEGRSNARKHRTRQAVYKDIRQVAEAFRLKAHLSPHSLRKAWAVEAYHASGGSLKKVQKLLNHENEGVTILYALADELTKRGKSAARMS